MKGIYPRIQSPSSLPSMEVDDVVHAEAPLGHGQQSRLGASPGSGWVPQVGVVVAVDRDKGEITLVCPGGTPWCLTAHASLLQDVRKWGVVQVVTDGTVIRGLRCL